MGGASLPGFIHVSSFFQDFAAAKTVHSRREQRKRRRNAMAQDFVKNSTRANLVIRAPSDHPVAAPDSAIFGYTPTLLNSSKAFMSNPANSRARSIQGQLLRLSERRAVAIYLRQGALWIADFIDGHGELIDAITWFEFNCGLSTTQARRRMVRESAIPLSAELVARIEELHRLCSAQHNQDESCA